VSAGSSDDVPPGATVAPLDDQGRPDGRVVRWRARADAAADRYLQRAQEQPLLGLPLAFIARYTARQGMLLASAAAFRLFLWLLPLALVAAGVLSAVAKDNVNTLESASKRAGITGAASQQVVTALREGHRSWWIAVIVGAVLFLWATRTLMRNLATVNAHVWGVPVPRRSQKEVLVTTLLAASGWIIVFAVAGAVAQLDDVVIGGVVIAILVQAMATCIVWLAICLRLPDRRRDWLDLLPGSIALAAAVSVLNAFSRVYLPSRFQKSSQLYGSLGVAAVMLAWLLIIGQLIVGSALINVVWSDYRAARAGDDVSTEPTSAGEEPSVPSA
jgi:uncharacterized BrkB/YihY/UPF0761 family membrane protein